MLEIFSSKPICFKPNQCLHPWLSVKNYHLKQVILLKNWFFIQVRWVRFNHHSPRHCMQCSYKVCQYMQTPPTIHWKTVKKGFCDINGTINYGVRFRISSSLQLQGCCDADWANDPNDRRSISGLYWFLDAHQSHGILRSNKLCPYPEYRGRIHESCQCHNRVTTEHSLLSEFTCFLSACSNIMVW